MILAGRFGWGWTWRGIGRWSAWFLAVCIFHGGGSLILNGDPGFGDAWSVKIPGGYRLDYVDVFDRALLVREGQASVGMVEWLQLSGAYLIGAGPDANFVAPLSDGQIQRFPDRESLETAVRLRSIQLSLEPVSRFYSRYRARWFDWACLPGAFLPAVFLRLRSRTARLQ